MANTPNASRTSIPGWGVDLRQEDRPGVPQELAPTPMGNPQYAVPERQHHGQPAVLGVPRGVTPVFSTANPGRGLSGVLRAAAYRVPPYKPRRWMMLLLADRVDVIEHNVMPMLLVAGGAVAVGLGVFALRARRSGTRW